MQPQRLFFRALADQQQHIVHQFPQVEAHLLHAQLAGFDLRQVEHAVDGAHQVFGRTVDLFDVVALHRLQRQVQCQVGHADDRVQRRADLMGHAVEKLRLGLGRPLGILS